jgi:hypothetical protein
VAGVGQIPEWAEQYPLNARYTAALRRLMNVDEYGFDEEMAERLLESWDLEAAARGIARHHPDYFNDMWSWLDQTGIEPTHDATPAREPDLLVGTIDVMKERASAPMLTHGWLRVERQAIWKEAQIWCTSASTSTAIGRPWSGSTRPAPSS